MTLPIAIGMIICALVWLYVLLRDAFITYRPHREEWKKSQRGSKQ